MSDDKNAEFQETGENPAPEPHAEQENVQFSESVHSETETMPSDGPSGAADGITPDGEKLEMPTVGDASAKPKKKLPGNVLAAVLTSVVAIAVTAGAAGYTWANPVEQAADGTATEQEEAEEVGILSVTVNVEGWDAETSTPVELSIYTGDVKAQLMDEGQEDPEVLAKAIINANEPVALDAITKAGTYTLAVTATPILEDGTLFTAPEPQVVEVEEDDVDAVLDCAVMDLSTASDEQVEQAVAAATEAAEKQESDSGNGKSSVKAATKANAAEVAKKAASNATAKKQQAAANKSNGSSNSNANQGSSTSNNGSGSSSGSSGNSVSTDTTKPVHEHNWANAYGQRVISYTYSWPCNNCSYVAYSEADNTAHVKETMHSYHLAKTPNYEKYIEYVYCTTCGAEK